MELPVLDPREQRVLGCLLEKMVTVPATYPLTLNAVRSATNQTSSRDPIVDWSESEVDETLRGLKKRDLVRFVWASGSRSVKYAQALDQAIDLSEGDRALLTVLLLRGAQAPGELRTRTERLYAFGDRSEVETTLKGMADRHLVRELDLRPREQDRRWVHLLGPLPTGEVAPVSAADREAALVHGAAARDALVTQTYDVVAEAYADHYGDELAHKPFDTWMLDRIAAHAGRRGAVVDVGTGPGHVAAYLASHGLDVTGIDVSPGMVAEATLRHPSVAFEVGDLRRLLRPRTAAGWSAITAWYALVHLTESELPDALRALGSTLVTGGLLALAVHIGPETRHTSDLLGHVVDVDFVLHDPEVVRAAVIAAGLEIAEWYVRSPLPEIESDTTRLYVVARKP
jgi:uncharacterized protein YceH (UPF0502 family)/SAM-dependent methyltransferase